MKVELLLAPSMKIYAADRPLDLIETNVIESLKAGSINGSYSVIWHKKMLFPSHEDVLLLRHVQAAVSCLHVHGLFDERSKSLEFCPVL